MLFSHLVALPSLFSLREAAFGERDREATLFESLEEFFFLFFFVFCAKKEGEGVGRSTLIFYFFLVPFEDKVL